MNYLPSGCFPNSPPPLMRWNCNGRLTHIWMFLWNHLSHQTSSSGNSESKHTDRLKNILMYIQEHYAEKITLADIAATANICQSECCRFSKNI